MADAVGIRPGDDLVWEYADGVLRVYAEHDTINRRGVLERLRLFDQATERQTQREQSPTLEPVTERGWSREDLYTR